MAQKNPIKSTIENYCELCDYKCSNKKDFKKHLMTKKHNAQKCSKMLSENPLFTCDCGKQYKHIQSINRHKKTCSYKEENKESKNDVSQELILKLVEENSEIKNMLFKQFEGMQEQQKVLQNQIGELIPKVGNNNNNTIKQKFNINIFLNEQCKDAITMNEFIDKIKITLDDLLITKNKGLSEGVSNIFIENMSKLSLHERPIHCTDVKRETVYVKREGIQATDESESHWEKDEENKILKQAIKKVSHKQIKKIAEWVENHPNWQDNSDELEEYMLMTKNCTDDLTENKREDKIIKKLCNKVHVGETI